MRRAVGGLFAAYWGFALGYTVALPPNVPDPVPVIERIHRGPVYWPDVRDDLVFCFVYKDRGRISFWMLSQDEAREAGAWAECSPANGPVPVRTYPAPVAWRLDENP